MKILAKMVFHISNTLRNVLIAYRQDKRNILKYLKLKAKQFAGSKEKQTTIQNRPITHEGLSETIGQYEEIFIQEAYKPINQNPGLIIDCGLNIGMASLYYKIKYPKARIIGFEPDEHAFKNALRNIPETKEIYNLAIGEKGDIAFYITAPGASDNSTTERPKDTTAEKRIQSVLLSDYIPTNKKVDILKIDTEGSEGAILSDLHKTGKIKQVQEIIFEYHGGCHNNALSEILFILETNGFSYTIMDTGSIFRSPILAKTADKYILLIHAQLRESARGKREQPARTSQADGL